MLTAALISQYVEQESAVVLPQRMLHTQMVKLRIMPRMELLEQSAILNQLQHGLLLSQKLTMPTIKMDKPQEKLDILSNVMLMLKNQVPAHFLLLLQQ